MIKPKIEVCKHQITVKDDDLNCQIVSDDVSDLLEYAKKLYGWATSAWDYSAVDTWDTEEYSLVDVQEGYFKLHKLQKDDLHGLFLGEYADSPNPLPDYYDREISCYVYIKISKDEFKKLSAKYKRINSYCTQNDGDCETCSLVNYGRDCNNNKI